jgi:hypothetical protein
MAITFTNIFYCRSLQNLPKLGFLVWKYAIWQPWCARKSRMQYLNCYFNLQTKTWIECQCLSDDSVTPDWMPMSQWRQRHTCLNVNVSVTTASHLLECQCLSDDSVTPDWMPMSQWRQRHSCLNVNVSVTTASHLLTASRQFVYCWPSC